MKLLYINIKLAAFKIKIQKSVHWNHCTISLSLRSSGRNGVRLACGCGTDGVKMRNGYRVKMRDGTDMGLKCGTDMGLMGLKLNLNPIWILTFW
jgi:hypothetical protein